MFPGTKRGVHHSLSLRASVDNAFKSTIRNENKQPVPLLDLKSLDLSHNEASFKKFDYTQKSLEDSHMDSFLNHTIEIYHALRP